MDSRYVALAAAAAAANGLPHSLVMAVIEHESSGRPAAYKPEALYRYLWDYAKNKPFRPLTAAEIASETPPADFSGPRNVPRACEWQGQQASWGLMQVMGAVAREHGFRGEFFTELCRDEAQAINIGCKYLAVCFRRFGAMDRAVAAYNAGAPVTKAGKFTNQDYVDTVLAANGVWGNQLKA